MRIDRWLAEASIEFDVPVEVLQAIAFVESRWRHLSDEEGHEWQPPAYGRTP